MEDYMAAIDNAKHHIDGTCISCGHIVTNKYCSVCGEKQVEEQDFALKHFLEESIEGFTHFDNKFFRTAKLLIIKPGLLSQNFSYGKRVHYLKPLQLFLICNLFFFLLAGKLNIFSMALYNFYKYEPFTWFHTNKIILEKARTDRQFDTLALAFNERVGTESKLFIVCFIPVLALACWLVFINKRRYFTEHLVFATHLFSFILIYYTIFTLVIFKPFYWISGVNFSGIFDEITSLMSLAIIAIYFAIAARRFYRVKYFQAISGAVFTMLIFLVALYAYRLMLFFKIIHGIHLSA